MGSVYPSILEGSSSIHGAREGKVRHDQPRVHGQTGRAAPCRILVDRTDLTPPRPPQIPLPPLLPPTPYPYITNTQRKRNWTIRSRVLTIQTTYQHSLCTSSTRRESLS